MHFQTLYDAILLVAQTDVLFGNFSNPRSMALKTRIFLHHSFFQRL